MNPIIISPDKVLESLVDGFEVLYIPAEKLLAPDGFRVTSEALSRRVFTSIEKTIKCSVKDDIFIKIERSE